VLGDSHTTRQGEGKEMRMVIMVFAIVLCAAAIVYADAGVTMQDESAQGPALSEPGMSTPAPEAQQAVAEMPPEPPPAEVAPETAPVSPESKGAVVKTDFMLKGSEAFSITGTVRSVIPADLTRPNSGIVITGTDGKDVEFEVRPLAVVYQASDGKLLSLTEVTPDQRVQVSYMVTYDGKSQATAVKILQKEEPKAETPSVTPAVPPAETVIEQQPLAEQKAEQVK